MNRLHAALFCSSMGIDGTFSIKHRVQECIIFCHSILPHRTSVLQAGLDLRANKSKAAYNSFLPSATASIAYACL
jgi:hypothetical protein